MFQGSRCFHIGLLGFGIWLMSSPEVDFWRHAVGEKLRVAYGIMRSYSVVEEVFSSTASVEEIQDYQASKNLIFERVFNNIFLRILRKKDLETKSGLTIGKRSVTRQGMLEKDLSKSLWFHVFHHPKFGTFRWRTMKLLGWWIKQFNTIHMISFIQNPSIWFSAFFWTFGMCELCYSKLVEMVSLVFFSCMS